MRRQTLQILAAVCVLSAGVAYARGLGSDSSRHYFLLDLRGDGFDLGGTNRNAGTRWTKVMTDDAFLTADATALRAVGIEISSRAQVRLDGVVLLSSGMRIAVDGQSREVGDAWQVVVALDAYRDGKLDSKDLCWNHLRFFVDRNGDGSISPSELRTAAEAGIRDITAKVDPSREGRTDAYGNTLVDGLFTRIDGSTARSSDVTFARIPDRDSVAHR